MSTSSVYQSPPAVDITVAGGLPLTQGKVSLGSLGEFFRRYRVVTFGKHQGVPISEVPGDYLRWMVTNFDSPQWKLAAAVALTVRGESKLHLLCGSLECVMAGGATIPIGVVVGDLQSVLNEAVKAFGELAPPAKEETVPAYTGAVARDSDVDWTDQKSMVDNARKRVDQGDLLSCRSGVWETLTHRFGADIDFWVGDGKTKEEAGHEIMKEVLSLGRLEKTERISVITLKHLGLKWTFEVRNLVLIELEDQK